MQIERIYYPVKSLGYGERIGIWTVGCPRSCRKCSNPELQPSNPMKEIKLEQIFNFLMGIEEKVDGVTISGGEPFLQAKELSTLVQFIKDNISEDILIYTGYSLTELERSADKDINNILKNIAVLIDGEYIDELNDNAPLRGSSNQKLHFLNDNYIHRYTEILKGKRTVQNVFYGNGLVSIGIPFYNFREDCIKGFKANGITMEQEG